MANEPIKFTQRRVDELLTPETGERLISDTLSKGLALRLRATGGRTWVFIYRMPGAGRAGRAKRVTIGDARRWTVDEARREAARLWGEVTDRHDPAAKRAEAKRRLRESQEEQDRLDARVHLAGGIAAYDAHLERREVKGRSNVVSTLRRFLLGEGATVAGQAWDGLGDVPLEEITRSQVMGLVSQLEAAGQRGSAQSLRSKSSTFLSWAADRGHIETNPLAGMRRERTTRAQRTSTRGRMLTEDELRTVWRACDDPRVNSVFGAIVRVLILTGQRRTETAHMRWADLDLGAGWWNIPAEMTKNGHAHEVPITPALREIIDQRPRHSTSDWVFTNNGKSPVSGWSKLEPKLREAAGLSEPWTLHDLRRSFRSGLTRLGADEPLAELMINHRPQDLIAVYDREPRLAERARLATRWSQAL